MASEKLENLTHEAIRLWTREKKLGVGGAFEDQELFGFGSFTELFAEFGKARDVPGANVVMGNDKKFATAHLFRMVRSGSEKDNAVELFRIDERAGVRNSATAEAGAEEGDFFGAVVVEILERSKNIVMKRGCENLRVTRSFGFPVTAEIDRECREPSIGESSSLFVPAFLVEAAAMDENDTVFPGTVKVRLDQTAVLIGEGNWLLRA